MAFLDAQPTLSKEATDFFAEQNLLSITGNTHKLSASLLHSTPTRPSSSLPGNEISSESFQATSIHEEAKSITIPVTLNSRETLQYLGFDSPTSQDIFNSFLRLSEAGDEVDFLELALSHINDHPAKCGDDWFGYMKATGIDRWLQDALMMPEDDDIRLTALCEDWLLETVADNYESLKRLGARLDRKMQEMKRNSRSKKARDEGADSRPITGTSTMAGPVGREERLLTSAIPKSMGQKS